MDCTLLEVSACAAISVVAKRDCRESKRLAHGGQAVSANVELLLFIMTLLAHYIFFGGGGVYIFSA